MRMLVRLGRPAHVYLFKNLIWDMEKRGHEIKIVARDKGVTKKLLDAYYFHYSFISEAGRNVGGLAIERISSVKKLQPIIRLCNSIAVGTVREARG